MKFYWIFIVILLLAVVSGCKKNELNEETTSSEDGTTAEKLFDDMFSAVESNDDSEEEIGGKTDNVYTTCVTRYSCLEVCTEVTNAANFERTVTLDFGTGCSINGKTRKGKIIAVRNGKWFSSGSTHSLSTSNYYVDGFKVDGTRTVTNNGQNTSGLWTFTVVANGTITTPDGETITWNSTRTRVWLEGADTWFWGTRDNHYLLGLPGIYDDVWEITGTATGTNRSGLSFTMNITTPLRVEWCDWTGQYRKLQITKGIIEIVPEDLDTRTIDYGDGSCDNKAVVKINDLEKEITL